MMPEIKRMQASKRGRKRLPTTQNVSDLPKKKAKEISKAQTVVTAPTYKGVVLTIGQNDIGQLGLGPDVSEKSRPAVVPFTGYVVDIAAGGMHTVCLTATGQVYTFGCNDEYALGRDTSANESEQTKPGKVTLPEKIVQISAGDSHSAALSGAGNVYIWGNFRDSSGSMGLTARGPQSVPIQLMSGIRVVQIASGSDHFVCLSEQGVIYSCGNGEQGQLGRIPRHNINRGGRRGIGLFLEPAPVRADKKTKLFDRIWTSTYATFAREKGSGDIYGFGLNNYFQLGFTDGNVRYQPEKIESFNGKMWVHINGGQHHTLALDEAGQVYCLGRREYGRLGLGNDTQDKDKPTAIPALANEQCNYVACGNLVSFAVTKSGAIYSWGMGTNEQLGHGNDDDVFVPKMITGKALSSKVVVKASGGGQHTIILAVDKPTQF